MKYIRTKDGIYKKDLIIEDILNGFKDSVPPEEEIIKQADTIEELCDKYVVEFNHGKDQFLLHRDFDTLDEVYKFLNEYSRRFILVSIKGAIWTDKGLIYVAKMNDKGELELL